MGNLKRNVWEGWTPQDFINSLSTEIEMIMSGNSFRRPFKTKGALIEYIRDNQPYYKESIPEVNEYFINKYGLKGEKHEY